LLAHGGEAGPRGGAVMKFIKIGRFVLNIDEILAVELLSGDQNLSESTHAKLHVAGATPFALDESEYKELLKVLEIVSEE
jgi:hypothetical protein